MPSASRWRGRSSPGEAVSSDTVGGAVSSGSVFGGGAESIGADSGGYNTAHMFRAAGREWLVLALDWRTSAEGFAWANQVIKDHPRTPVILTTHEIATPTYSDDVFPYEYGDPENDAELSSAPPSRTPRATTSTCTSPTTRTAITAARP